MLELNNVVKYVYHFGGFRSHFKLRRNSSAITKSLYSRESPIYVSKNRYFSASFDSQFDSQYPFLLLLLVYISEHENNSRRASIQPVLEPVIRENTCSELVHSLYHNASQIGL
jgi:hypothetical protein